jgi:hypothetical protein
VALACVSLVFLGVSQRRFFPTEPVSIYSALVVRITARSTAEHGRLARTTAAIAADASLQTRNPCAKPEP